MLIFNRKVRLSFSSCFFHFKYKQHFNNPSFVFLIFHKKYFQFSIIIKIIHLIYNSENWFTCMEYKSKQFNQSIPNFPGQV